ncbi:uncharacterized protein LOC113206908 [Frankliniella occidentalis]|uniref:Uncharacterized protein LOC113206908 n=1 Tax=Frankliniella occidentalis TaxID=133901 RepID=A0A9C6U739_FRAOC|nr:uncharacterized protein LOC113206908 [Frankliniella occidentalis]
MSAVVANLPAPAVTAPHAILLTPGDAGGASGRGKLFFHPFFPLLHFMHFPHLFLGGGLGHHHGLGGFHHGLGGFHHGLGGFHYGGLGGFHHGLGGFHHGLGGFPFRALPPELKRNVLAGTNGGAQKDESTPRATTTVSASSTTPRPAPPPSPPGTTRLAPLPDHSLPHSPPPPFKAFITPKRKVVPVFPVSAYRLPAALPPPVPAYATHTGPLRLTAPGPAPAAEPDIYNFLYAPVRGLPHAYAQRAESSSGAPAASASEVPTSVSTPAPPDQNDENLPLCECPEEEDAASRVELDHSPPAETTAGPPESPEATELTTEEDVTTTELATTVADD